MYIPHQALSRDVNDLCIEKYKIEFPTVDCTLNRFFTSVSKMTNLKETEVLTPKF